MGSHNEVRGSLDIMGNRYFSSYSVRKKTIILSSWGISGKSSPRKSQPEKITIHPIINHEEVLRGDIHIRHQW